MKTLLIKIGKAWHVIQREGVVNGGRRVVTAFFALFRKVEPGDILFVSGGVGDSARYRTEHVAEELTFHGFKTSVTVQDNPFLLAYVDQFSVFVFHRVLFTAKVKKLIEKLKALKKEIIFETDDLVFDPRYLENMDYYKVMNPLERKLYEHGVGGEILSDPYVKVATTTTHFLADKLSERGKRSILVPNRLSKKDMEWGGARYEERKKRAREDILRIGYLSGTPSHNKDFATILASLTALFSQYKNIRLVLAGPLDTGDALNAFKNQIEILPFVPREKFFEYVASLDVNLAPLEIGNPFCESKSELKFFEAGIVGVPTVAAATQTFREAITDGVDSFVASNEREWREKLERLIIDESLRGKMGEAARQTALERYTTKSAKNEEYYTYLRSKL